jgi:dihydrodiol dehydrogenase / D-xylose 1-dehydrogenase (NADP)
VIDAPVQQIRAITHFSELGADLHTTAILDFGSGRQASITCAIDCALPNEVFVTGTRGTIHIPSPMWCPETFSVTDSSGTTMAHHFPIDRPSTLVRNGFNFRNSQALKYEAIAFQNCVKDGSRDCPPISRKNTLQILEVLDRIRDAIGLRYTNDTRS